MLIMHVIPQVELRINLSLYLSCLLGDSTEFVTEALYHMFRCRRWNSSGLNPPYHEAPHSPPIEMLRHSNQ